MSNLATNDLDIDLIKRTIAVGASNDELALFAAQCRRTGLDPFSRQINFVMRRSKSPNGDWSQKATIMVSIDGARLMAARTGLYNGSQTWWCGDDANWLDVWMAERPPTASKVTVWRGQGQFTGIALWREYGAPAQGPVWRSMPAHMLAKCAEMLALRKAFPAELSGLYSADEMAQSEGQVVEMAAVVPAVPKIEVKDKPTRIIAKLPYYKHPAHLLASVRKELGQPGFEFPKDDDADGWELVWTTAKAHAAASKRAVETATPIPEWSVAPVAQSKGVDITPVTDATEPADNAAPPSPTAMQDSVDKQVQQMLINAQRATALRNTIQPGSGNRKRR